jgi:hypothetical protein
MNKNRINKTRCTLSLFYKGKSKRVKEILPLFFFAAIFFSCEKESNYRFKGIPLDNGTEIIETFSGYPAGGELAFHENFQLWQRDGYINFVSRDCEQDQMTTSVIMYVPGKPLTVTYNGFTVSYTLQDFSVNPLCGNQAGKSTADSEVSTGYVALQQLIFYECGQHDSDGQMVLSPLPSVSRIRFSLSLGGKIEDVAGVTLWKKSKGASAFAKVGDYIPTDPEAGELFTVEINEKDVQLKFVPALTGKENPVNDGVNRAVRIHDLWVWSL